jgi:hypothetical protein
MDRVLVKSAESVNSQLPTKSKRLVLQLLMQSLNLKVDEFNKKFLKMENLIKGLYGIANQGVRKDDPLRRKLFPQDERIFGSQSSRMGT